MAKSPKSEGFVGWATGRSAGCSPEFLFSAFLFFLLWLHGSLLGLTDDEAYYWVLAQKPALGYAYHPPAVAWAIAFFQSILGGIVGTHSPVLVRLPSALGSALILLMGLRWLREAGLAAERVGSAALILLSFFGFFALSWMMVPDIPLLLGWMLMFTSTWRLCTRQSSLLARRLDYLALGAGTGLAFLSKYSALLALISVGVCIVWMAPRRVKWTAFGVAALGGVLGLTPSLVWNSNHHWMSLLYQIRDRHEGHFSLVRYLRFWLIEAVLAGPILIGFFFNLVGRGGLLWVQRCLQGIARSTGLQSIASRATTSRSFTIDKVSRYCLIWILPPALVFCLQPLYSDFKPHWAFVVWLPTALALAWTAAGRGWKSVRFQVGYGAVMGVFVLMACHLPMGTWILKGINPQKFDPKWDVTNDLYGWSELEEHFRVTLSSEDLKLPVVGSRYQTASQAAFQLSHRTPVSLAPRDEKERDEWPDLKAFHELSGEGLRLRHAILFVADNRYDAGPAYAAEPLSARPEATAAGVLSSAAEGAPIQARCEKKTRLEKKRAGVVVKWIDVWRCDPV